MLFRNENPVLGPLTQENESGTLGTNSTLLSNNFKPMSREFLTSIMPTAASHATGWLFIAPWKCQVIAVKENHTTASTSGTLDVVKIQADAVAPATANGGTIISMLTAPLSTAGAANTRNNGTISVAAGNPTVLNAGDQLAIVSGGTATNYVGGVLQVEVVQLG